MPNIGAPEVLLILVGTLTAAVPVAALVVVYLTYKKVCAIEKRLEASLPPRSE